MLRWASMVFRDDDGVVHYCQTEHPLTVCGESRLPRLDHTGLIRLGTIRIGDGLPLSPVNVLPPVTCILCIDMETAPAWV